MQLQIDFLLYQSIPQTPPEADHTLNHTVMFFLGFIITDTHQQYFICIPLSFFYIFFSFLFL